MSLGAVSQQGAKKFDNLNPTVMSFDQIGFVYSSQTSSSSYINFAFNYHKGKNFNQIISVNNVMAMHNGQGASLGKLAFAKSTYRNDNIGNNIGGYDLGYNTTNEKWMGYRNPQENREYGYPFTQWDYLYTNVYNVDDVNDPDGIAIFSEADDYYFDKAHRGWTADYDFNLSGNSNNRFFWGLTIGVHDVNYRGYSIYDEMILNSDDQPVGTLQLEDERHIDATGVDVKAGVIFLPIEDSPFRIGLSVATPTWYDVKSKNWTTLYNNTYAGQYQNMLPNGLELWGYNDLSSEDIYEYKYYTPWKFGLSLGHTIGKNLALGASYEYSDYGAASNRVYDGTYNYYDEENTSPDDVMNDHTGKTLKGVSLLKLGAEYKPDPQLAIRLGYNYQSAAYNENGIRDTRLNSPGTYFSSTADYVNWKATNRLTCGIGYKHDNFAVDLAYQYSMTDGTFYPFQPNVEFNDPVDNVHETNISTPSDIDFKRHQVLLTLTYNF